MKIIKQIAQIINGVGNTIFKKRRIEELSKKRMEICRSCPLIDLKGDKCMIPGTQPCCGDCGCKLEFATRSENYSCPQNKW